MSKYFYFFRFPLLRSVPFCDIIKKREGGRKTQNSDGLPHIDFSKIPTGYHIGFSIFLVGYHIEFLKIWGWRLGWFWNFGNGYHMDFSKMWGYIVGWYSFAFWSWNFWNEILKILNNGKDLFRWFHSFVESFWNWNK